MNINYWTKFTKKKPQHTDVQRWIGWSLFQNNEASFCTKFYKLYNLIDHKWVWPKACSSRTLVLSLVSRLCKKKYKKRPEVGRSEPKFEFFKVASALYLISFWEYLVGRNKKIHKHLRLLYSLILWSSFHTDCFPQSSRKGLQVFFSVVFLHLRFFCDLLECYRIFQKGF